MALVARRTGKRRRLMADINVVPYVDVMLVLVVILMVAAPFVNPGVVELPTVEKAGQQKGVPLRVVVRSERRRSRCLAPTGARPAYPRDNWRPRFKPVLRALRRRWSSKAIRRCNTKPSSA